MTNLTILVHDRPVLTRQTLDTMLATTSKDDFITIWSDDSTEATDDMLVEYSLAHARVSLVTANASEGTGIARNRVIAASEQWCSRGDYLYLSDNDCFFKPGWLPTLIAALEQGKQAGFRIVGGCWHPYNPPFRMQPFWHGGRTLELGEVHALSLQSMLMSWETWDQFGPFVQTPAGKVRASEDVAFSQKLHAAGFRAGVVIPPVILNTSRTDSFGELVPGHELILDIAGVIVE